MDIYYVVMGIFILISSYWSWRFSKITPEVEALDWGHVRSWLKLMRLGAIFNLVAGAVLIIYGVSAPAADEFAVEVIFLFCVLMLFNLLIWFARSRILTNIFNGTRQNGNNLHIWILITAEC